MARGCCRGPLLLLWREAATWRRYKKWQLDNGASVADVAAQERTMTEMTPVPTPPHCTTSEWPQERAEAEMAYYATSTPAGYTRDIGTLNGRTGGRLYNPYAQVAPRRCVPLVVS